MPLGIVACTFSDNLSRYSCIPSSICAPQIKKILILFLFIKVHFMVLIQDDSFFAIKSASVNISLDDLHSLLMRIMRHIKISLRTSKKLI